MPIYEFRCESCGHEFELLIMHRDEIGEARCPKCQSPECSKLMSTANMAVSGSSSHKSDGGPNMTQHTCDTGTCMSCTLPGYER